MATANASAGRLTRKGLATRARIVEAAAELMFRHGVSRHQQRRRPRGRACQQFAAVPLLPRQERAGARRDRASSRRDHRRPAAAPRPAGLSRRVPGSGATFLSACKNNGTARAAARSGHCPANLPRPTNPPGPRSPPASTAGKPRSATGSGACETGASCMTTPMSTGSRWEPSPPYRVACCLPRPNAMPVPSKRHSTSRLIRSATTSPEVW